MSPFNVRTDAMRTLKDVNRFLKSLCLKPDDFRASIMRLAIHKVNRLHICLTLKVWGPDPTVPPGPLVGLGLRTSTYAERNTRWHLSITII